MAQTQKEISARYYKKHKEKIAEKRKGTRQEENKSYYQRNKEYMCQKAREWRKRNPDKIKQIQRKSRAANNQKRLFNLVKNRSKAKNIDFSITIEDIIIPEKCPYLDMPFIYGDYLWSMSVDRIDPSKGYIKGNIEVISTLANRMKNVATKEQLLIFAKSILNKYRDIE